MNRIIIADICSINKNGKSSGHYFPVAQNYVDVLGSMDNVLVAGGPIYRSRFESHHLALPYDTIPDTPTLKKKCFEFLNCIKLFRNTKGDIIIMQNVAQITTYLAILLFYRKKSKLFLIQYYTESVNTKWKKKLWSLIKGKVNGIICSSTRVGDTFGIPYRVITDYIYTDKARPKTLAFDDRKYDFCLVGVIQRDKGQVEALKYFVNKGLKVVIAGKIADESLVSELEAISQQDSSIEMHLGYVTDADYYSYIRNSKYCILNYSGTYNDRSSGVVLDILFNQTPVVGHECGALNLIAENKLGLVYDDISKVDFAALLTPIGYQKLQANIKNYLELQRLQIHILYKFLKA